ncbi:hypothetical protein ACFXA3_30135 [Streptomyces sp. NPDC059456]|uniref:hypothetical protein n=1 Tax=Streptomyces sp. NPDC059456 TaxID=3346838 RepID=UPI0036C7510B
MCNSSWPRGSHPRCTPWRRPCACRLAPWECPRRRYIPERHEDGRPVDISFATLNRQKAVRDKNRPSAFVCKHFEAMVCAALAEELRTGDVAVAGSEEYADRSEQLLPWEDIGTKPGHYVVEVGLAEPGEATAYDAATFRRRLEDELTAAAATADAGYPDNEGLVLDPVRGDGPGADGYGQAA